MFRSRSRFNNEAPMSRRGVRIGLVSTVVLAMVAVLASTVGVLSSQSTTPPSLTFDSNTGYDAVEGESLTITLTSTSSTGYDLVLRVGGTTPSSFNFDDDVTSLVLSPDVSPDVRKQTSIRKLPQTVSIESGTSVITLWFRAANDLMTETGDKLVLEAQPGSGNTVNTEITLADPPIAEATFSVTGASPITVDGSTEIGITLKDPLTLSQLFSRRSGESGYTREELVGSNFQDISSLRGADFELDDNNERYNRNLGFDFWFYGKRHSNIAVHTNGFVGFTNDAQTDVEEFANPTMGAFMGDATPGTSLPIVAPLLSPIGYIGQPGAAFYGARKGAGTANDRYIVQYTNAATLTNEAAGTRVSSTFQVVLYANGRIEFRYKEIPTSVQGVSKIGISNGTGSTMFDEFSYREANLRTGAVRLVYTPKDSVINAVIKDSEDNIFETVDFLANVPVGMQSGSFMVSHPDDNTDWDGSRVYTVELASTVPLVTAPDPAPDPAPTYTVNDNDDPVVILKRADGSSISGAISIDEDSSVELVAELMNAPSGGAPEALTVNLDVTGSTAEANDYTVPATVTIPAGQDTSPGFMVGADEDNLAELEEMLTIEVGDLVHSGGTVNKLSMPEKVDITIPIDPNDTITATVTTSDADEGGMAIVNITLDRMLPDDAPNNALRLFLESTDRDDDLTESQREWDLTANLKSAMSTDVMIPLMDDTLLEGAERVTVSVRWVAALNNIITNAAPLEATFDIGDANDGIIGIVEPTRTLYNEGDTVILTVELTSAVGVVTAVADINFDYRINVGTTVDGNGDTRAAATTNDIDGNINFRRTATIPAGEVKAEISIVLTNDNDREELEVFQVSLERVYARFTPDIPIEAQISVDPASATPIISILDDNEPLEYSFVIESDEGSGMVSEDNTAYTVQLRRLGTITETATVAYTVSGIGSKPTIAADFASGATGNFVFNNYNAESTKITLMVADDAVIEGPEDFRIALTSRTETHDVTLGDNDQPQVVVEWVSGSTPVAEGGSVRLVARLTNGAVSGATEDLTVNLAWRAGSTGSASSASDVSFPSSVVIDMGSLREEFDVDVTDDALAEFNEMVNIYAVSVVTMIGSDTLSDTGYSFEITSDDKITARVDVSDTDRDEGAGHAQVTITLSQRLPENVSSRALMLNLVNSERQNDLSGLPADVTDDLKRSNATQPPAETSVVVMIPLVDDTILEGAEGVSLSVSWVAALNDIFTNTAPLEADFTIIDNEDGRVAITAPSKTMYQEGDTFDLTIALPTGVFAGAPIMVDYRIEFVDDDGNGNTRAAASAADITGGTVSGSATIPANQNSIPVTIDLNDDSEGEETELFKVSLARVVADIPATRDLTARIISILDNEQLEYSFVGSGTVSEGSTAYTGQLRRLGTITEAAMVTYAVSGIGSSPAVADDFDGKVFPSGNFEFTNYNARAKITLTVADDKKLEAEETFRITSVGKTHDVKLVDNESGEVRIDRVGTTSPEDGDMVEFDVSLPDGVTTDSPITVNFEIVTPPGVSVEIIDPDGLVTVSASGLRTGFAQGLALPVRGLAQVVRTSYSIMIPAGQTSVKLTIQLTHDGNTEVREQLMVRLLSASGSSASAPLVVVNSNMGLANVLLENFDAPDFGGVLPATGGPVLPVWLLLTLALTGVVLAGRGCWYPQVHHRLPPELTTELHGTSRKVFPEPFPPFRSLSRSRRRSQSADYPYYFFNKGWGVEFRALPCFPWFK